MPPLLLQDASTRKAPATLCSFTELGDNIQRPYICIRLPAGSALYHEGNKASRVNCDFNHCRTKKEAVAGINLPPLPLKLHPVGLEEPWQATSSTATIGESLFWTLKTHHFRGAVLAPDAHPLYTTTTPCQHFLAIFPNF